MENGLPAGHYCWPPDDSQLRACLDAMIRSDEELAREREIEASREAHDIRQFQIAWEDWRVLPVTLQTELRALAQRWRKAQAYARHVEIAEAVNKQTKQNARRLQKLHRAERENQHCVVCGVFFNRDKAGKLLKEADWCDPRKERCTGSAADPFCLARQDKINKAIGRQRRKSREEITSVRPLLVKDNGVHE